MRTIVENEAKEHAHIKGWGVDADEKNDPTYPMKHSTGDDHHRIKKYERPPQQLVNVEILKSNERSAITSVFGTSSPPSGLSGAIRRFAFRFGEGSFAHWLPLLLADRVNVVEGIIDDLKQGHIPNIFVERGWKAEWKYNRKGVLRRIAVGTMITSAAAAFLIFRSTRKKAI